MELNLIDLKLGIRTSSVTALGRLLSLATEEFSEACKRTVCRFPSMNCAQCSASDACDWLLVFGQQLSADPEALRRHQKPPLPFIFSIPVPSHFQNGVLECGMVVVGRAITALGMLLAGLRQVLAENSDCPAAELIRLFSRDSQGNSYPLNNSGTLSTPENLVVMSAEDILSDCPWECECLTVRLLSPLRLFARGRQLDHFDFTIFARSLMRRVSSLAYYYCGYEFDCDFKAMSESACRVVCEDDHYEAAGGGSWKTTGIGGYGRFAGNFGGLLPILVLGEYVHAGKNAPFGMGAYRLEIP